MTPQQKAKPTYLLKAFYENLNLAQLFPLLESDFDLELGSDGWKQMIGVYKNFGKAQKVSIPSFDALNRLFDPSEIVMAHATATTSDEVKKSHEDLKQIITADEESKNFSLD